MMGGSEIVISVADFVVSCVQWRFPFSAKPKIVYWTKNTLTDAGCLQSVTKLYLRNLSRVSAPKLTIIAEPEDIVIDIEDRGVQVIKRGGGRCVFVTELHSHETIVIELKSASSSFSDPPTIVRVFSEGIDSKFLSKKSDPNISIKEIAPIIRQLQSGKTVAKRKITRRKRGSPPDNGVNGTNAGNDETNRAVS